MEYTIKTDDEGHIFVPLTDDVSLVIIVILFTIQKLIFHRLNALCISCVMILHSCVMEQKLSSFMLQKKNWSSYQFQCQRMWYNLIHLPPLS